MLAPYRFIVQLNMFLETGLHRPDIAGVSFTVVHYYLLYLWQHTLLYNNCIIKQTSSYAISHSQKSEFYPWSQWSWQLMRFDTHLASEQLRRTS